MQYDENIDLSCGIRDYKRKGGGMKYLKKKENWAMNPTSRIFTQQRKFQIYLIYDYFKKYLYITVMRYTTLALLVLFQ